LIAASTKALDKTLATKRIRTFRCRSAIGAL
jgi:hypothetical protein